jgi:hypothetical protein
VSDATNRRLRRRRRLQDPPTVEVAFCDDDRCLGGVKNEHLQGLGVVFHGTDAMRAWSHRSCCLGRTLELRVAGKPDEVRLPVRLIHLTRPVRGHLPCRAGVSLDRGMDGRPTPGPVLELWTRLQGA